MSGTPTVDSAAPRNEQIAVLEKQLRAAGALGGAQSVVAIEQMSGGWSRHSYLATAIVDDEPVGFVVRVEAPGGVLETDIATEYAVLAALDQEAIATPHVLAVDDSGDNPFDGPYFVMEKVAGEAPNVFRSASREMLELSWQGDRAIASAMVETLARLHSLPLERLPSTVPSLSYADVVGRWRDVYERYALVRDPVIEEAFRWLDGRDPGPPMRGLVHGDYRIGNALVEEGGIRAVLDWELSYVGDVRFDLGYLSLERLAGKHLRPVTELFGAFAERDWFIAEYERLGGAPVDLDVVRTFSVLGIMMLMGTITRGTWMYAHGKTSDFRLAWARFGAPGLRQDLTHLMQW